MCKIIEIVEKSMLSHREAVGVSLAIEDNMPGYRGIVARILSVRVENGAVRLVVEAKTFDTSVCSQVLDSAYTVLVLKSLSE